MFKSALGLLLAVLFLAGCNHSKVSEEKITFLTLKGPSAMGMIYLIDSPSVIIPRPMNIEILDEPMLIRARLLPYLFGVLSIFLDQTAVLPGGLL
jgi:hypothetical protein